MLRSHYKVNKETTAEKYQNVSTTICIPKDIKIIDDVDPIEKKIP